MSWLTTMASSRGSELMQGKCLRIEYCHLYCYPDIGKSFLSLGNSCSQPDAVSRYTFCKDTLSSRGMVGHYVLLNGFFVVTVLSISVVK